MEKYRHNLCFGIYYPFGYVDYRGVTGFGDSELGAYLDAKNQADIRKSYAKDSTLILLSEDQFNDLPANVKSHVRLDWKRAGEAQS